MTFHRTSIALLLLSLAAPACALLAQRPPIAAEAIVPPARFAGDLPCADCAGIRTELDLRADGRYFLRHTYLGRGEGATHEVMGAFALASDGDRLTLRADREASRSFRVVDADTLRMLDRDGAEIASQLDYALRRVEPYRRLAPGEVR